MNLTTVVSGGAFSGIFRLRPHHFPFPFLFIILFITTANVFGQVDGGKSFHLKSVSAENTLQESAINSMMEDSTGYLWLGTSLLILLGGMAYRIRITELKKAQAELKKQVESARLEIKEARRIHERDERKIELYTNISHEFRTPLTLIAGPVSHLIKHNRSAGSAERLKLLRMVARNIERLLRLVNQFPDLSKLDEAAFTLKYSRIDLTAHARKIADAFAPLAENQHITFRLNSPEVMKKTVDPDAFEKILYNLLSNAFKFTPHGGAVDLIIEDTEKDYVLIQVRDTGQGIDQSQLQNIFERFGRHRSPSAAETGIGLNYVKQLAELHGGHVHIESTRNAGSTFSVTLRTFPCAENHTMEKAREIEHEHLGTGPGQQPSNRSSIIGEPIPENKVKILVIDNDAEVRAFIRTSLRAACSVTEARDAAEGLALAIATVPEIIVCDVMMPTLSGLELCRMLKTNEATSHIPVILLTAKASEYHKREGYRHGADSYITKPFTTETLLARINNLITERKKLRHLYFGSAFLEQDEMTRSNAEIQFLRKCFAFISKNLDDPELDSADFCKHMAMSQAQLYRKLMAVAGMPISDFIQSYRLRKAALLLRSGKYTIAEIAYQVGFKDPSYFSKCFARHYGSTPSQYLKVTGVAPKSAHTI